MSRVMLGDVARWLLIAISIFGVALVISISTGIAVLEALAYLFLIALGTFFWLFLAFAVVVSIITFFQGWIDSARERKS